MIDLVLRNCRIFGAGNSADTIGIKDGRISYLGSGDPRDAKDQVDLEGKTVLPGFIDSHTHLLNLGLSLVRLDLSRAKTREEALGSTARYATDTSSNVVVGYGWDETTWGEKDYISKGELDGIGKPVVLYRKDMHMAVLNSKALEILGIESENGAVKEERMKLMAPLTDPDMGEVRRAINAAAGYALSEGITTVRDIMGIKVRKLLETQSTPLRVFQLMYDSEYSGEPLDTPDSWGVKMFLDGSIGSRTAAHEGWDTRNLKYSGEDLDARLLGLWRQGIPAAMHAIGEIAVEQAVKSLKSQKGTLRNSIEHFELVHQELLEEIGNSTVISSQPNFLQWSIEGGLYENTLGSKWKGKDNPFRKILDAGVHLAFGSDCMPMGPSFGIGLAVNSKHRDQRITLEEALKAYTTGGAYLLHEEQVSGKIAAGYKADFAIFDESYLDDPKGVGSRKPFMTIIGGVTAYREKQDQSGL